MHSKEHCPLLVVDDSQDHLDLLKELFDAAGFETVVASNGKEALEVLHNREQIPCCIFLDLMMPVMDGQMFRAEQLKDERYASIPVVVMSASAQVEDQTKKMGASGYIKKPVDMDVLLDTAGRFC